MRIRKALSWVLAAIFLLMVLKLVMAVFGGFRHAHHFPRHGGFGYGGHRMGGFHFIWPFVSAAFWIAVIGFMMGWVKKKMTARRVDPSFTASSLTYHTYPSYGPQDHFLDEWEKNQMNKKENE